MRRCRPAAPAAVLAMALAAPLLLQGCQTNMSNDASADAQRDEAAASGELYSPWPLKFKKHNLGIHCFDTYGCKVVYDGRVQAMDDPEVLQRSSASLGADYRRNWLGGRLGFRNFPPPAKVSWRSKDGVAHETSIDFGEIFKDQLVRHNVPRKKIPSFATFRNPDIFLEVNDRTIRVYMLASIPLKEPRIPGNRFSTMERDLILAHTESF
ncbi:hypothetical protein WCE37_07850 [Luteimonas sp. MJ250]|uniref:hypothetical protein n=1 Tax=Luteimonas sp. MJ250 TaxID=3129236 RepID=UPI0031BB4B5E